MEYKLGLLLSLLFGLIIGSFLNAVIYRLPRKLKLTWERSHCPSCKEQLKWYHNIPLVSYLVLRGKCGFCQESIGWRYPLVELLNASAYVLAFVTLGLGWQYAAHLFLASVLIVIFFIDIDFQIIPDLITLPGLVLGLAYSLSPGGIGFVPSLIGLLVGGGSLYLVAILGDWLFKKDSMGGGDIKMAAMLGAFLGWQKVVLVFMGSAVIGLIVSGVIMLFSARLRKERVIPFGPFIAAAAVVAIIYGEQIISFYVSNYLTVR
ncbi:MAG: prepilin peptidase [bacterium]|nr:prepilin peptidase [bacterium]